MRSRFKVYFVTLILLGFQPGQNTSLAEQRIKDLVNDNTVGLISGGIEGTYVKIASDLSQLLDDKYNFRVVPIIGKGSKRNVEDLLYLEGVDLAIVQSDLLNFYGKRAEDKFPDIEQKIYYISELYNEEIHLVASKEFKSVDDLAGGTIGYGPEGGGSAMTAENIFDILDIVVEFEPYKYERALRELQDGTIQALVHVAGKPVEQYRRLLRDDGLHLLSLPVDAFDDLYPPTTFTADDYPGLVEEGQPVATLSISSVLAAYNWDRSIDPKAKTKGKAKLDLFTRKFIAGLDILQSEDGQKKEGYHPKWLEVDLKASLPCWRRLPEASRQLGLEPDDADANGSCK